MLRFSWHILVPFFMLPGTLSHVVRLYFHPETCQRWQAWPVRGRGGHGRMWQDVEGQRGYQMCASYGIEQTGVLPPPHIHTGCFIAMWPKINECCRNIFCSICNWMVSNERTNNEVFVHVLHAMKVSIVRRSQPLQSKWPKWPPQIGCTLPPAPWSCRWRYRTCSLCSASWWWASIIKSIQL